MISEVRRGSKVQIWALVTSFGLLCLNGMNCADAVEVDGTPTCFRALEELAKQYPGGMVKAPINLRYGGSYIAVEKLGNGAIDIAVIEYPLRKYVDNAWAKAFPTGKTPPIQYVFAQTALGVVVNKRNALTKLTHEQLRDIWSGKAVFWRDVGGSGGRIKVLTSMRLSSGLGIWSGRAALQDLALKYVQLRAVIQASLVSSDSDVAAVGAFVRAGAEAATMPTTAPAVVAPMTPFVAAGGKELLFLSDKPSARAMEIHGQKWNALGRDSAGKPNGTGPAEYLLAGRAAAVVVNPANTIDALTIGQLQAIFGGEVEDWGTLGNSKSQISGSQIKGSQIQGSQIKPYGLRSDDLATGIFEKECLERPKWKRVGIKKDSAEVLAPVSMDPQAIGFVDLAGISATGQSIKILAIKLGSGERAKLIQPTPENIKNAMYPLSQRLWLYVHPQASDTAKDFVKFIATCGASEASPYADTVKAVMDTSRK